MQNCYAHDPGEDDSVWITESQNCRRWKGLEEITESNLPATAGSLIGHKGRCPDWSWTAP